MPSMMAIVSKAVFEKTARGLGIGDVWPTDRYVSKKLAQLAGGDLYLVTVRPGERLWLVGVLAGPRFDGTQWIARASTQPIRDISALTTRLAFANGAPLKTGALGMSLQTARVLTAADVALLAPRPARPSRSAKAAKPALPAKEARAAPAKQRPARASATALAHDALRANDGVRALALLVEAWADDPHPQLADVIRALSAEVRTPPPANLRGNTAAALAAWDARSRRPSAADIPMLLESLCDVSSGEAAARLVRVEAWMPDPRIDAALVEVLRDAPYRATSTKPFWMKLFALAAEIRDPAQRPRLAALDFAAIAVTMREFLVAKTAKLVAVLPAGEAAPRPSLDELAALVGGRRSANAADRADIDHLVRAVYEAPDDDGPRVVLADALIEREDPRGELITVQLQLARDPGDRALKTRERELLAAHGKSWLGDLAPILMAGATFERGFLATCKIDNSKLDRVQKLVGNPAWATVRALEGSALIALDPVMRSLRTLVFRQGNARRHELLPDAWRDLLVDTPRAIEDLQYESLHSTRQWLDTADGRAHVQVSEQPEVDALCACRALPQLRRLALRDNPVLFIGKLANAPVLERLESLGFLYERNNRLAGERGSPLVAFTRVLAEARVPTLRFEIGSFHATELVLERGAKGYERARMTIGPTGRSNWSARLVEEALQMLGALPALRELRVTARKATETQQVARLRAAATERKLDVCEVG